MVLTKCVCVCVCVCVYVNAWTHNANNVLYKEKTLYVESQNEKPLIDASYRHPCPYRLYKHSIFQLEDTMCNNGDLNYCAKVLMMYSLQSYEGKLSITPLLSMVISTAWMCYFENLEVSNYFWPSKYH